MRRFLEHLIDHPVTHTRNEAEATQPCCRTALRSHRFRPTCCAACSRDRPARATSRSPRSCSCSFRATTSSSSRAARLALPYRHLLGCRRARVRHRADVLRWRDVSAGSRSRIRTVGSREPDDRVSACDQRRGSTPSSGKADRHGGHQWSDSGQRATRSLSPRPQPARIAAHRKTCSRCTPTRGDSTTARPSPPSSRSIWCSRRARLRRARGRRRDARIGRRSERRTTRFRGSRSIRWSAACALAIVK